MKKYHRLIAIICAITTSVLSAQHLNIRNYSIEDGLVQSQVHAIVQDDEGYIWFGTGEGLSKFDGKVFINFNRNDGIAANFVESGLKDNQGNLWFGHFNGRVTKYSKISKNFENIFLYPETDKTSKAPIYKIFEDLSSDLWFVTQGQGLFHLRNNVITNITTKDGLLSDQLFDIIQLPDSSYWIGTQTGINILRYNQHQQTYNCKVLKLKSFFTDIPIHSLFMNSRNDIWIETGRTGIYRLSMDRDAGNYKIAFFDHLNGFTSKEIGNIIEDNMGNIWISTVDQGVFQILIPSDSSDSVVFNHITERNGLSSDFLNTIFEDNENNLWIGSDGSGVSQIRDLGIEVYGKENGLVDECVWAIHEDSNGKIWIGHDRGISCLTFTDGVRHTFKVNNYTQFKNEDINHVLSITEDNEKNIWFFSLTHKPIVLNNITQKMSTFDLEQKYGFKNAITMLTDRKGIIWYGSSKNGILKVNDQSKETELITKENNGISSNIINTIYMDSNDHLWFGTENGGVMRYDGQKFNIYSAETHYPITSAVSISEDDQGRMWFVSSDDHLFCLNDSIMTLVHGLRGIDGKTIYSVTAHDDNLWIGTTNGLCKVFLDNLKTTHFGMLHGYPISEANENATLRDSKGNLWFGTINGVVKILPHEQKSIADAHIPDISKIQIFLQDTYIPENRQLKYNQNHITFHFRSICLTTPEQVKYKYFLKGFDEDWSPEINDNHVTYSNLNPGEYEFNVIASNANSEWNEVPAQYAFEIKTPFWQTWWFYALPILLASIIIYFFILQRIMSIEKSKIILEKRVKRRTTELQKEKSKFEQANRDLLAEKERLMVTLRSIVEGVITTDETGKITMINSTAEEICEIKNEDAIGKSLLEVFSVVHIKTREMIINPVDRIKHSGELFSSPYNNVIVSKNGDDKNIWYSGSPIRDKDSTIMGFVIVCRDVTEQLKIEKELIKNQKLESLGVLAGGIAHDFNNLLTAVTGNLSLSRLSLNKDHEIYNRLELAEKATERARDLIQQLMTFSKGGVPVKQTTTILELVRETTEFVLRGSKVKCEMNFPSDLYPVEVDPGQMNQVIHNMILNANQAMPKGGTIKISAKNIKISARNRLPLKSGKYIQLNIEDNGLGIRSSHKQKIFDPFFTTKTDGSGLGLASAFSIIKRHQGYITLDSEVGKGSTFKIYLPATTNKVIINKIHSTIDYKGEGKILIMDDENYVLDTASDMLSFLGFNVVCVKDGSEVLKEYRTAQKKKDPYNAVILDLTIPGGMGGEVAIKKLLNYDPHATAIVASGYSSDPIMANYSEYGFKARLIKPYNMEEVGSVLQDTLSH